MRFRIGIADPAGVLLAIDLVGEERERFGDVVSVLDFELREVDRAFFESWRSACLEATDFEAEFSQE